MRSTLLVSLTALVAATIAAAAPVAVPAADILTVAERDVATSPSEVTLEQRDVTLEERGSEAQSKKKKGKGKNKNKNKGKDKGKGKGKGKGKDKGKGGDKGKNFNLLSKQTFSGQATWYEQHGNYGSCGWKSSDGDKVVAVNTPQVANQGHCGKWVVIQNTANGRQLRAKVADECPTCAWGSLDLSVGAFKELGNLDQGVLPIKWYFD
ncbi:hypothetical protein OIV83_000581 [Microbotryomycetes sp. JL201]|nr:hypothetical protein OIV83_000581 [Microbotryomycetes sp. JL201]